MYSKTLLHIFVFIFYITNAQSEFIYSGDGLTTADASLYTETTITAVATPVATTMSTPITTQCSPLQNFITAGGTNIDKADDNYEHICFPIDVPVGGAKVECVYMYTNGIISTKPDYKFSAVELTSTDYTTFSIFWTDIDIRKFGTVTYKTLEKYPSNRIISTGDQQLLDDVNKFIDDKEKTTNFDAVFALIVTWNGVTPHQATTKTYVASFQFILVTDGVNTYVAYIYDICNLSWDPDYEISMGYSTVERAYNNLASLTPNIIESLKQGNTGSGIWSFFVSTSSPENNKLLCLQWHMENKDIAFKDTNIMKQCPCNLKNVKEDPYFVKISEIGDQCYGLKYSSKGNGKVCCYKDMKPDVRATLLIGNIQMYVYDNRSLWLSEDVRPYEYCCINSDYCDIFTKNRPTDDCSNWVANVRGFSFGDPHFLTLDGKQYTFNGYGEYELLNIYNKADNSVLIQIQCRTKLISQGTATVFEAFAFKTDKSHVQIMTSLKGANVVVYGDGRELTQFRTTNGYAWTGNGVFVRQSSSNRNIYLVAFNKGITATVEFDNSVLEFGLSLDIDTSLIYTNGLLGTYNGNITDDFQLPNKINYIPIDSTEQNIFTDFGSLWSTNSSIFIYENGFSASSYKHLQYIPTFLNRTLSENSTLNDICNKELTCIFDLQQTGSMGLALTTKEVSDEIAQYEIDKEYKVPFINCIKDVVMTRNKIQTLEFNVTYDKALNLTLNIELNSSAVITMSGGTVTVVLMPKEANVVSAAFYITTDKNQVTTTCALAIQICPECKHNGTCNLKTGSLNPPQNISCSCTPGWAGADCSIDDRCAPYPCLANSTDEKCWCECPTGYKFMDDKCLDIDECSNSPCNQTCLNTIGSYKCSCKHGYTKSGNNCTDFDECTVSNGCQHNCNNAEGTFLCSCNPGYTLNADGKTCNNSGLNNCTIDCSNFHGCKINNTGPSNCFCNSGYINNGKRCKDTNECNDNTICGNGMCNNTDGGYYCYCKDGYTYEKTTKRCVQCKKNYWGKDCNNTCSNKCATCNSTTGCICISGLKGISCDEDIDECKSSSLNNCDKNTTVCKNSIGSHTCVCKDGYKSNGGQKCKDIDECKDKTDKCHSNADCINTIGNYTCKCKSGFNGTGYNCTDFNECTHNRHNCEQNCKNTEGSFSCKCKTDYRIADDRISCIYEGSDECIIGNHTCSKHARCEKTNGTINCTCKSSYEGDGFKCTVINECETKTSNCSVSATCSKTDGGYTCTCNPGFTGDGNKCTASPGRDDFYDYVAYAIVGAVLGVIALLFLLCCCLWCCCIRRRRRHGEQLISTLEYNPYNVRQGFGSLHSSLSGTAKESYPIFGNFLATKYLQNWGDFSPDQSNDPMPGPSGTSVTGGFSEDIRDSRWQHVLDKINKTEVFHIDRPEITNQSYNT